MLYVNNSEKKKNSLKCAKLNLNMMVIYNSKNYNYFFLQSFADVRMNLLLFLLNIKYFNHCRMSKFNILLLFIMGMLFSIKILLSDCIEGHKRIQVNYGL